MEWIVLILIIFVALKASVVRITPIENRLKLYLQQLGIEVLILLIIILLIPGTFRWTPFELWSPTNLLIEDWLIIGLSVSSVNFFFSFTNLLYKNVDLHENPIIFGLPAFLLPKNGMELATFSAFILGSVIFEELIFRMLLFGLLFNTVGLSGWPLLVAASVIFSLGHGYQRWRGLIGSFFMGLVFGLVYLESETIWWPIALHALHNFSVVIYASRRMFFKKD
ncbi:MAG: CPBP family intramembrane metalloprotease [Cryomorphaceae bacterium]|nr:CPBP family intramembrane metalloprotease [Cryomorphaceae bacterium]